MPTQVRPKSIKNEGDMSQAVACNLVKYAAREVKVGDCKFDVVAYNKEQKLFKLVECKLPHTSVAIGHAFGQVAAYSATIAAHGRDFIDVYSKKLVVPMRQGRWMEATDYYRRIKVEFYVALSQGACARTELLRSLKKIMPYVGIIRVKRDGVCRPYLRVKGDKDDRLNKAVPVTIKILRRTDGDS
jgi:hypothetical protein